MTGQPVKVASTAQRGVSLRSLSGIPLAMVMFVLLNWVHEYHGAHAASGRPFVTLLAVAAIFGVAAWLRQAHPASSLVAGWTVLTLIVMGLLAWSPSFLDIDGLETDPWQLLGHGAISLTVTALAVVLLVPRQRAIDRDNS